ncbi:wd repeat protein 61 [Stylonychia lemnae]|uniref:WD40 repeat-containing protein SMU1 n=1 Tax=Stylonychia lemnae TaxID=5949 RepID=A0A077ZP67_STYLE|nr:wd repeat protein 61 [Stylonychia lemnae]|eukprot:CDW71757.1 wd repeat protein 61 [Stylonychia lemnae]
MEANQQHKLDLNFTVELVLQFLKENNLQKSFQTLSDETNVNFNQIANKEDFLQNIKKGFWHQVLKQIQYISIDKIVLVRLYEHIIKELLIQKEYEMAQYLIQEQTASLLQEYPDILQNLWDITQIKEPPHTFMSLFGKKYESFEQCREDLTSLFDKVLENENNKHSRLLQLIAQGLEYEKKPHLQQQYLQNQKNGNQVSQIIKEQSMPIAQKIVSYKVFQGDFQVQTLTISHDSKYLVLGGQDGLIEVWNFKSMSLEIDLSFQAQDLFMLHRKAVLSLLFSKDDKILASGDQEGIIKIWKFIDGKKLREIDTQGGENAGIGTLCLTSNNSQIIAGCLDRSIKIYGLKSGNLLRDIKGLQSFILSTFLIPSKENLLLTGTEDGQIILWNTSEQDQKAQKVKVINTPNVRLQKDLVLNNFQISLKNSTEILVCYRFKSAYLINYETGNTIQEYSSNQSKDEEMLYAQFSGDGLHVYAYSSSKNLYVFDTYSGKLQSLILVPNEKIDINGLQIATDYKDLIESAVIYSLNSLFKLSQTQGEFPFNAKNEIGRTLYKPQKLSDTRDDYFPWGGRQGGGGDPFRDQDGNIITNKKIALARNESNMQNKNYITPYKDPQISAPKTQMSHKSPYGKQSLLMEYKNYSPEKFVPRVYDEKVLVHNPANLMMFQKAHSATLFDYDAFGIKIMPQDDRFSQSFTERNTLVNAGSQIMNQSISQGKYEHFDRFVQERQQQSQKKIESLKPIVTNSTMFPVNNTRIQHYEMQKIQLPQDQTSKLDHEVDISIKNLQEIEKLNKQTEEDVMVYQFMTQKRENVEKLLKDLEFNQQFPELKTKIELEQKLLIANNSLKGELKTSLYKIQPGKDIVYELIEQSVFHDEIDKIRRDLNEYSYRSKDPSYLFKEHNSIVFNLQSPVPNDKTGLKQENQQTKKIEILKSDDYVDQQNVESSHPQTKQTLQQEYNLIQDLLSQQQQEANLEKSYKKYELPQVEEEEIKQVYHTEDNLLTNNNNFEEINLTEGQENEVMLTYQSQQDLGLTQKNEETEIIPKFRESQQLNLYSSINQETLSKQHSIPQRYSVEKSQNLPARKSDQVVKSQVISNKSNQDTMKKSNRQSQNPDQQYNEDYEDYVEVNEFGIADNYD